VRGFTKISVPGSGFFNGKSQAAAGNRGGGAGGGMAEGFAVF